MRKRAGKKRRTINRARRHAVEPRRSRPLTPAAAAPTTQNPTKLAAAPLPTIPALLRRTKLPSYFASRYAALGAPRRLVFALSPSHFDLPFVAKFTHQPPLPFVASATTLVAFFRRLRPSRRTRREPLQPRRILPSKIPQITPPPRISSTPCAKTPRTPLNPPRESGIRCLYLPDSQPLVAHRFAAPGRFLTGFLARIFCESCRLKILKRREYRESCSANLVAQIAPNISLPRYEAARKSRQIAVKLDIGVVFEAFC